MRIFPVVTSILLSFLSIRPNLLAQNPIREALQPYVDHQTMAGFVSILAEPDGTLQTDCIGYADFEKKIPMRPDTLFYIYSSSKSVCGMAIAICIDQGKLDLDTPIARYFPEFARIRVRQRDSSGAITFIPLRRPLLLRDCMTHTTGSRFAVPTGEYPLREVARRLAAAPFDAQPGETFRYGNNWIDTCAALVQEVSGMSYEDFLQKHIFTPLGMKDTTFWPTEEQQKRFAQLYNGDGKPIQKVPLEALTYPLQKKRNPSGASALYSTPADFIKFSRLLAHHGTFEGKQIVSRKTFDRLLAVKQTPKNIQEPYTLGNWLYGNWLGHEGWRRTDARANLKTGHARLYFVQTTAGEAFARSKKEWHRAADQIQKTFPPFEGKN